MAIEIELTDAPYGGARRRLNTRALEPGDRVAILDGSRWSSAGAVFLTVERVTATQIIMQGPTGRTTRYRRDDGTEVGGNRFRQLYPVDHPRVVGALQQVALRDLMRSADELGRRKPSSHEERMAIAMELAEKAAAAAERMRALEASANPDHDTH